ncbi:MAG TPA: hypothetical protein QF604_06110 [Candidatus Latescibacteria bacterium]|jgi:hypothetical protein|nr:hypothetical protein [Gemmatimonadota bacterium]MBU10990.1 hypothetical protein [Gemmatimonadota bacterium]MDP7635670.1 hypothetical protein [Candidatus Latescibacterota bacterium]HJN27472.1 hypothetical protein [Candidatus Latescibacterota bacterium]|tara:strand:- start:11 stop:697 length:687 start_codon:yes stop_codon:yes gene_type:complete
MEIQATGRVIDGSALARGKDRPLDRVSEDAVAPDPDRAIETARRTVINRAAARSQANRVKDGQSLSALKATGGPPAGALSTSSLTATSDNDRSRTSLFDLPSSGGAVIDRMRGQVRPSSPLNGLLGGSSDGLSSSSALNRGSTGGLLGDDDGPGLLSGFVGVDNSNPLGGLSRGPMSLSSAQELTSGLRSNLSRISNSSRSLLQVSNPLRTSGGFGLQLPTSSLNLLG